MEIRLKEAARIKKIVAVVKVKSTGQAIKEGGISLPEFEEHCRNLGVLG
jgi:hypothetical protein